MTKLLKGLSHHEPSYQLALISGNNCISCCAAAVNCKAYETAEDALQLTGNG